MEAKLFIPILLGTVRQGRESEKVATLIQAHILKNHLDLETTLIDPRNLVLPQDDEGTQLAPQNQHWQETMQRADGLIIVVPEYNRGYPGSLKGAIDILLKEYIHKPVGLVGVSSGFVGGARAVEALLPVLREVGLVTTFTDMYIPQVREVFNEDGSPKDEGIYKRIDGFLEELMWMGQTLQWGRNNVPSKYHQ